MVVAGLPTGAARADLGSVSSSAASSRQNGALLNGSCSATKASGGSASRNFATVGALAARYRDLMLVSLMTCASFFLYVNWRFTAAHAPSPIITGEFSY